MWNPAFTKQFRKDYKKSLKRGLPATEIESIMLRLLQGLPLAEKFRDHTLKGSYNGFGECHIRPDWLLIYLKEEATKTLTFVRTGSHSDLFDE